MFTRRLAMTATGLALVLGLASACGSDKKNDDKDTSTTTKYDFTKDINPVIVANCGGTTCHGTGATGGGTVYEGSEANFKAKADDVATRLGLATSSALYMPQDKRAFADADRQKLLDFLGK